MLVRGLVWGLESSAFSTGCVAWAVSQKVGCHGLHQGLAEAASVVLSY